MRFTKTLAQLFAATALTTAAHAQTTATEPSTAPAPDPQQAQGASTGGPDAATSSAGGLADIVVTATRVESSAQKTAIALTVYGADALATAGVNNVAALQSIDPSVNVTRSTGTAYVAVRGVASTDVTEIGDPSVPIARDGFYTNRAFGVTSSFYDISRVEVLKGPQGTLNGRNSTGGLVSIITNRPGKTSGGYGSVEVGNFGAFTGEMGVNLALTDSLQVRASGIFTEHKGYRRITGLNERGDDEDTASGRLQVAFQPFDGFKAWASYQHDDTDNVGDVTLTSTLGTRPDFGNARQFPNAARTSNKIVGDRYRWEFSFDQLPLGLTLTYAGGYDKQVWNHKLDATGPSYPATRQFIQFENPRTWNHEVRISSVPGNPFFFQAGLFHFDEKNSPNSGLFNVQADPGIAGTPFDYSQTYGIKFNYNVRTKSNAVFGQASYAINDKIKISAGARYTRDTKTREGQAVLNLQALVSPFIPTIPLPTGPVPIIITTPGNGNLRESRPTFHGGIDFTPTNTTLIYAKVDTGYKSGGFNSNGSSASLPYGPETLTAYEIGTKNRFLDNNLQLNVDGFYMDYKGYQASQTSGVLQGNGVFNVGSAKIYGAEAQVVALLRGVARIDANATYLHTRFGDNISVSDGGGATRPIGGNRLPNAPSFVFTAGIEHEFDLTNATVTARVDGKYSSSFYYSVFNDPDVQSHDFFMGNASITYAPANGHWKVQGFVRNFTNKVALALAARNYVSNLNTYQFQPPRTYGVRGSFSF